MKSELWDRVLWICQLLATISLGIGLVALSGYASDQTSLYQWNKASVGMAIPTAIAVSATGLGLFCTIEYLKRRRNGNSHKHK